VRLAEDLPSLVTCIHSLTAGKAMLQPESTSDPEEYFGIPRDEAEGGERIVARGEEASQV
jgi:hypothetical protein